MLRYYALEFYASINSFPAEECPDYFSRIKFGLDRQMVYRHLAWMCRQGMEIRDGEKGATWVGFIQGAYAIMGDYSIMELREHNRNAKIRASTDTPK